MFSLFSPSKGVSGNGAEVYQCLGCGGLITYSDRLIDISGSNRHLFVNPAGLKCDIHIFTDCPGATALGEATEEHTWFPGYSWRLAFCRLCAQHLGWHYEAVTELGRPREFWGILVNHLVTR